MKKEKNFKNLFNIIKKKLKKKNIYICSIFFKKKKN